MKGSGRWVERLVMLAFVTGIAIAMGCGGSGGDNPVTPGLVGSFSASDAVATPNLVRLRSGTAAGDHVVVEVAIGGPTTSSDLYFFAFDLVLSDPSVAQYVAGSATMGDALTTSASQTGRVEAAQSGNHVVIGVTKLGGGSGNAVTSAEAVVVRLTFRVLKVGGTTLTFAGSTSPQNPTSGPAAVDSAGSVIPSVQFDDGAAALTAS